MKRFFLFTLVLLCAGVSTLAAQKAKFKSKITSVQQARLPVNLTDAEDRTYDIITKGRYSENVEAHSKRIYGWQKNADAPKVKAVVNLYGYSISPAKRNSEKKQTKDKEGKVTASWTEYWYTGSATGKGTLYIYGHSKPFTYESNRKRKTKAQEKAAAKKEAEKEALAANPFLSAEDTEDAKDDGESEEDADEGLVGDDLPLVKTVKLDRSTSVKSARSKSVSAAYKDYVENQRPKLSNIRNTYGQQSFNSAISTLNAQYGFAPVNNRFYLKEMKSEKHGEYRTWNDACAAVKTLFKAHAYNKPIDANKFAPIITYFEGQVNSIPESDKKARNQKKAAYQNLLNILYYLDMHDEVMAWSDKFLEDKKLDKLAKDMGIRAERQKALLAFHGMESSHFQTDEEISADDIEDSEIEAESDEEGKK